MIRIQIPATSANLGSGFDSLGTVSYTHLDVYKRQKSTWSASGRRPTSTSNSSKGTSLSFRKMPMRPSYVRTVYTVTWLAMAYAPLLS